jgi:hypothetical protein
MLISNNLLELNDDKSTVMIISRRNALHSVRELQVCMNGRPIKRVVETQLLGQNWIVDGDRIKNE